MFFLHTWPKSPPTTQNLKICRSAKNSECTSTKWNRKKPFLSTDNTSSRWHKGKIEIIIAPQWIRVRGGQCLSFGPQTTSPRTTGSARCSLRPWGHTSTRQDSSASSQSSRRPENRERVQHWINRQGSNLFYSKQTYELNEFSNNKSRLSKMSSSTATYRIPAKF